MASGRNDRRTTPPFRRTRSRARTTRRAKSASSSVATAERRVRRTRRGFGPENQLNHESGFGLQLVQSLLEKVGGKIIWAGNVKQTVIGDYTDQPDRILVVYYPSKEAFIEMSSSKEYEAIGHQRHESLVYGGLIATETM